MKDKKKILVLGTGNAQKDLILACKEAGLDTYACSYRSGDSAEKYADHFALLNITDVDAIEEFIRNNGIDYVYSAGSDIAMPTASKAAEDLGLPRLVSSRTAVTCNEKGLLRKTLGEDFKWNIPFQILRSKEDPIRLEYPFVMKPVDSQGQRGVFKIHSKEEFDEHFDQSVSHSREKAVIIEKYIGGSEVSVNAFCSNGKVLFRQLSDRIIWPQFPGGIIHEHHLPSRFEGSAAHEEINEMVDDVLSRLDIQDGPAYFQIKIDEENHPYLIEVTPRLDGCHMWKAIREYEGINLLDDTLRRLLGQEPEDFSAAQPAGNVRLEFLCQAPGTEMDRSSHDVSDADLLEWYYEDGQTVRSMNGYMEKCGYKIVKGDSK